MLGGGVAGIRSEMIPPNQTVKISFFTKNREFRRKNETLYAFDTQSFGRF